MNTKLTLTLDDKTIEVAKRYAKENKTSLSKLVEFYFRAISADSEPPVGKIPPITKGLSGIAVMKTSKTDKELLNDALNKKFL